MVWWVRGMCSGITQVSREQMHWYLQVWWKMVQLEWWWLLDVFCVCRCQYDSTHYSLYYVLRLAFK
jgi:hypothetical protein